MTALFLMSAALLSASPARAEDPEQALKAAHAQAQDAVEKARQERLARHKRLERLRKDLRYIAEELDRELVGPKKDLAGYSAGGLARLRRLRKEGDIHPRLADALDRLEALYKGLPKKGYLASYRRSVVKAIALELRWIADEAKTEDELLALLKDHLVLPDEAVGAEDAFSDLALFPVDLPLEKFRRLGPIRIFLVKHRLKRPKSHLDATPEEIVGGKHNVQIGVTVEGVVRHVRPAELDGDYTFNFGDLHLEITPEWRLLHPKFPRPTEGQRLRVKGWTYWDTFHKSEEEYDPEDPVLGINRATVWEVHPVQEIEILSE